MRLSFMAWRLSVPLALSCVVVSCGGGGSDTPAPPPPQYSIGGSATGLANGGSVVLQNNGTGNTSIATNGSFVLTSVTSGTSYAVTVLTQPAGQVCTVTNASGVATAAVTNIAVTCGTSNLALLAGDAGGPGNIDGSKSAARFNLQSYDLSPRITGRYRAAFGQGSVAIDADGNLFIADSGNNTIRKITPDGAVTTLAGKAGVSGDVDGVGSEARFSNPTGVATDSAGRIYVADTGNHTIRMITPGGAVTTLAGTAGETGTADGVGSAARFKLGFVGPLSTLAVPSTGRGAVAADKDGNVYVADSSNATIRKITPAGVVSTLAGSAGAIGDADGDGAAARFTSPVGIAVDNAGNVYVADSSDVSLSTGNTIRKITATGTVTTLAGASGMSGKADGTGSSARFSNPASIAVDAGGNVFVADNFNNTIRKITPVGVVTTVAGGSAGSSDGTGADAKFALPGGVAVDSTGNVFVTDSRNHTIRKITSAGVVTTFAGAPPLRGNADGSGVLARFDAPAGIAADATGNLYVADANNNSIRKLSLAGAVTTLAGTTGAQGATDGAASSATFNAPGGVAADGAGNVFVADTYNQTIRKITPQGVVSTLAGSAGVAGSADGTGTAASFRLVRLPFPSPTSLALPVGRGAVSTDAAGNVYVADAGNHIIRKITSTGVVTTLAGGAEIAGGVDGTGAAARFSNPNGVATDSAGNLYVADSGNNTIRKITSAGVVTTIAGTAGVVGSADGTGAAASFNNPQSIALDGAGNVYVADTGNNAIRKITPAGVVSTVVGKAGAVGLKPGTLPGTLPSPVGIAVSGTSLVVSFENGVAKVEYVP